MLMPLETTVSPAPYPEAGCDLAENYKSVAVPPVIAALNRMVYELKVNDSTPYLKFWGFGSVPTAVMAAAMLALPAFVTILGIGVALSPPSNPLILYRASTEYTF